MYRYEEIAFVSVGYIGAFLKTYECVVIAGHYHFDILEFLFYKFREFFRDSEIYLLLSGAVVNGTVVMPSVSGVDDHCELLFAFVVLTTLFLRLCRRIGH